MPASFSQNVIETIEKRNLSPAPRWNFLMKRGVFWTLAAAAVSLGGVAVSVMIFIFLDHDYSARSYIDQGLVDEILLAIPYLWLATLVFLLAAAGAFFRHTGKGYRQGALKIVGVAFAASLALGIVLDFFDVGAAVNEYLHETVSFYDALVYTSKDEWSRPQLGLLGGTITQAGAKNVLISDFHRQTWSVDISSQKDGDDFPPMGTGSVIKIVGEATGEGAFRAMQIFPWQN